MRLRHHLLPCCAVIALAACSDDSSIPVPDGTEVAPATGSDAGPDPMTMPPPGDPVVGMVDPSVPCRPVQAEPLPTRVAKFGGSERLLSASDLYKGPFSQSCGSCHIESKAFGVHLPNVAALAANLDKAIERIKSTNPATVMPPGKLLSARTAPDPVVDLLALLEAWKASGAKDLFVDPRGAGGAVDMQPLAASPELGKSFSNLGSCIPAPRIVGTEAADMELLDAKFAAFTKNEELPNSLSETDLFTLESEALAKRGVISFAPGYTLWADDAKKMRYVRVPKGTSIVFSPSTQGFAIPDNTRFYKTFLKQVTDVDGNVGYKKLETRLILVRHTVDRPGQAPQINALYGTYAWNEDETEAVLEKAPLANGTPFKDHVTWYLTDEQKAKAFLEDTGPDGLAGFTPVPEGATVAEKRELGKSFLLSKQLARTYAIPGSERCVQCHEGAVDGSFSLGFLPMQIMRRPMGEGGVIEPSFPDELNQLERLISYGLITGLKADEVERRLLKLEKSQSERSPRNDYELIAQGYMLGNCAHCHNPKGFATRSAPELLNLLNFFPSADGGGIFQFPLDRVSPRIKRFPAIGLSASVAIEVPYISATIFDSPRGAQPNFAGFSLLDKLPHAAPWRSLIYRNVETPFTYSGDGAIYPHMPLNTPGYDARLPTIMAEWMLSIPARQKTFKFREDEDPADVPMQEVVTSDPEYGPALKYAEQRVEQYRAGRGMWRPKTDDIVDRNVRPPVKPVPEIESQEIGVPNHPHWVEMDLTDPVISQWLPRNLTWYPTLVDEVPTNDAEKQEDFARLIPILREVHLDDQRKAFASTPVPLGLWEQKPACDFSSQKKVSDFSPEAPWIAAAQEKTPSAPVLMRAPGEAVFGMVCVNCHGKQADSRGRQADSLLLLTGGGTRVANFRAGLFGPPESPGANLEKEFGKASSPGTTAKDWAARYMAFMALGGTNRLIPSAILNVVANGAVAGVGVDRQATASANMLSVARAVCASLLPEGATGGPASTGTYREGKFNPADGEKTLKSIAVIERNGDADLWRSICTYDNLAPVGTYRFLGEVSGDKGLEFVALRPRAAYPSGRAVMDHRGSNKPGLTDGNLSPWCVLGPEARADVFNVSVADTEAYYRKYGLARCPPELEAAAPVEEEAQRAWSLRGAVNAGLSVFVYLDDLTNNRVQPAIEYNQCEQLSAK